MKQEKFQPDYDVGYGRPPKATQFQKGQSGNPKGRPKGSKNVPQWPSGERLKQIIEEEAYRAVPVQEGGRTISIPIIQLAVRAMAVKAAKGDQRSQRRLTEMLAAIERQNKEKVNTSIETVISYKIEWDQELRRREQLGIKAPDPIPHPDDIKIDVWRGTIEIAGPMTKEEKQDIDMWIAREKAFEEELTTIEAGLNSAESEEERAIFEQDLAHANEMLGKIKTIIESLTSSRIILCP